ncbi:MAG: glycosyltransferase family 4 protein, partial [Oscillospiraceae bacterium]
QGLKQYQVENSKKLFEKWQGELAQNHYPNAEHVARASERTRGKKRLLLVDHYVPTFDQDAGSRTIYEYIRLFQKEGYQVVLLPANFFRMERYTEIYQQMGVEVLYGPWYQQHWDEWLVENGPEFDLVFLSRPHIAAEFIDDLRRHTHAPILYYGHDLHHLREQRQYAVTKDPALPASIERWRTLEFELIRKADAAFYPSRVEEDYLKAQDPGLNVFTLPAFIYTGLEPPDYHIDGRRDLLFVGGFNHLPNVDAMRWFSKEIWPLVTAGLPGVRLHIVGSHPPEEIMQLAGDDIIVHGFVSDEALDALYQACRISVVPLRYGAGIKGKVVEALAKGLPVITTPIGAEGLLGAGRFIEEHETPEAFARAVVALYGDEARLAEMAQHGYIFVKETFSPERVMAVIHASLPR